MAKKISTLANMRKAEQTASLSNLSDRELCEMIRTHFESHPTLPGEKILKDQTNQILAQYELEPSGITSVPPLPSEERKDMINGYVKTRIRETPLKEGNYYLDFRHFDPFEIKRETIDLITSDTGAPVVVEMANVELQNNGRDVYVLAEMDDGGFRTIGTLPDKFLTNSPMNVDSCKAQLQLADYSNGKMKNLSVRVIVDTDLMSGDVIDLNDDMIAGLSKGNSLEQ